MTFGFMPSSSLMYRIMHSMLAVPGRRRREVVDGHFLRSQSVFATAFIRGSGLPCACWSGGPIASQPCFSLQELALQLLDHAKGGGAGVGTGGACSQYGPGTGTCHYVNFALPAKGIRRSTGSREGVGPEPTGVQRGKTESGKFRKCCLEG